MAKLFKAKRTPDLEEDAAPDLTDTNGAPGAMDEDGELEDVYSEAVIHSMAVRPAMVGDEHGVEVVANIHVAAVHAAEETEYELDCVTKDADGKAVKENGIVQYHKETRKHRAILRPGGMTSKRQVVVGTLTVKQLCAMLRTAAAW